jgi:hypothetical protein
MAFEVALLVFLGAVIIVAIVALAKPVTEMFAEKMKFRYREMGSESEKMLKDRVNFLEGEMIDLKQHIASLSETVDFVSKEVEQQHSNGDVIKTRDKQNS